MIGYTSQVTASLSTERSESAKLLIHLVVWTIKTAVSVIFCREGVVTKRAGKGWINVNFTGS